MKKNNKLETVSLWLMIKESIIDHLGKVSSTRINGYWMSILFSIIVICGLIFEIHSAFATSNSYIISNQMIALATLILGQQALLFNLKRKSEDTSFPTVEKLNTVDIENSIGDKMNIPTDEINNINVEITNPNPVIDNCIDSTKDNEEEIN